MRHHQFQSHNIILDIGDKNHGELRVTIDQANSQRTVSVIEEVSQGKYNKGRRTTPVSLALTQHDHIATDIKILHNTEMHLVYLKFTPPSLLFYPL